MFQNIFIVALIATVLAVGLGFEIEENIHLKPRTKAPGFKAKAVINDKFINVALDDYINAKKWSVLLFYPFDYTFVCPVRSNSYVGSLLLR